MPSLPVNMPVGLVLAKFLHIPPVSYGGPIAMAALTYGGLSYGGPYLWRAVTCEISTIESRGANMYTA